MPRLVSLLPLTLLFFSWGSSEVHAAHGNESCAQSNQRLQLGTYQFTSDCDAMWWCNSSNICDWKGCRKDEFPFGYTEEVDPPDTCPRGFFCPDEEDACQELLPVGSPCQLNRDDQCEAPPDFQDLADNTGLGRNVNGSVCLNNVCMWANQTLGLPCTVENIPYTVYTVDTEYIDIVSRDDCRLGLYCDASQKVCMQMKDVGASCTADKECQSFNCLSSGVCGKPADTPVHVGAWVYVVCGIAIFGGMIATLIGMYYLHRGQRDVEREKRMQYWREQNAFRQNIIQMQQTARNSLMSLPLGGSQRNSLYGGVGIHSEDSQAPMLHKSSALRHYVSDDGVGGSEESIVIKRAEQQDPNRF